MTVNKNQLLIGGGVIFWRLASRFNRNLLMNNLALLGYDKYCPEERTNESALRESLKDSLAEFEGAALIRPLKNPKTDGYAVVQEDVGEQANEYHQIFTARVDEHGEIFVTPPSDMIRGELYTSFNRHKGTITSAKVASCLVEVLEHLGATSLRDNGGFYWLHDDKIEEWLKVAEAVEAATAQSTETGAERIESAIYLIRTQVDNLSARALKDAIVAEVKKRAIEISDESNKPGLKQKAFLARQKEAQALHDRVKYFEDLLGEGLKELHAVADKAEDCVIQNGLNQIPGLFGDLGLDAVVEAAA